jgi:hypothetical protein
MHDVSNDPSGIQTFADTHNLPSPLRPNAVCRWLVLARELGCTRLANRCIKTLQAEFILVEATDPQFRLLSEEDLVLALGSSAIVCGGVGPCSAFCHTRHCPMLHPSLPYVTPVTAPFSTRHCLM